MALRSPTNTWKRLDLAVHRSYREALRLHLAFPSNLERNVLPRLESENLGLLGTPLWVWQRWEVSLIWANCIIMLRWQRRCRNASYESNESRVGQGRYRRSWSDCLSRVDYAKISEQTAHVNPSRAHWWVAGKGRQHRKACWRWFNWAIAQMIRGDVLIF